MFIEFADCLINTNCIVAIVLGEEGETEYKFPLKMILTNDGECSEIHHTENVRQGRIEDLKNLLLSKNKEVD
jgi:hypothetical protein